MIKKEFNTVEAGGAPSGEHKTNASLISGQRQKWDQH